jgi:hypothetical protein
MKRLIWPCLWLILLPGLALAQGAREKRGWGYAFVAPGAAAGGDSSATLHVGAGGEGLISGGLGLGGEVGYLTRWRDNASGFGLASANVSYHFNRDRRLVPFFTGGASLAFNNGTSGGGNVGGGVQYWFAERAALRLEFRTHVISSDTPHSFGFRVGIAFR